MYVFFSFIFEDRSLNLEGHYSAWQPTGVMTMSGGWNSRVSHEGLALIPWRDTSQLARLNSSYKKHWAPLPPLIKWVKCNPYCATITPLAKWPFLIVTGRESVPAWPAAVEQEERIWFKNNHFYLFMLIQLMEGKEKRCNTGNKQICGLRRPKSKQ